VQRVLVVDCEEATQIARVARARLDAEAAARVVALQATAPGAPRRPMP
jgi:dephospho-CoA kinase